MPFVDSDWAGGITIRKSVTCLVLMLAGDPVAYKSKSQPTVAHSNTEAEFSIATDCAKTAFYLCSILEELGLHQQNVTKTFEDNTAAIEMANAQRPTRQTRHVDIKYFAFL